MIYATTTEQIRRPGRLRSTTGLKKNKARQTSRPTGTARETLRALPVGPRKKPVCFCPPVPPRDAKCILVVDDDYATRDLLGELFEHLGYRALKAGDSSAGARVLSQEQVDLVITDVVMPGRSGIQLLEDVRKTNPDLPVIIITGLPDVDAAVSCIKIGALDYLTKPVNLEKLAQSVESALSKTDPPNTGDTVVMGEESAPRRSPIAGYNIVRTIGEGSMGIVFLAEKEVNGQLREYAVKILKDELLEGDAKTRTKWLERFRREAEMASTIHHPGIVDVIEFTVFGDGKTPCLVMEYCAGMPLDIWMRKNRDASYSRKATIVKQVAQALTAMHAYGICHRDVKPANVLVDGDLQAKLTDFGLSMPTHLTGRTVVAGTPVYMAPEIFAAKSPDHRSDLFSLGVTAYQLFLGVLPFDENSVQALSNAVCTRLPPAPTSLDPDFPMSLQNILARLLRKDPARRYQSAEDVVCDLEAFLTNGSDAESGESSFWQRATSLLVGRDWR